MPKHWTENQENAIFSRGGSVLVSAAAGSGKTAVLVQRIIELITSGSNPVDADRLLVVTFTRAAAGEMKDRVINAVNSLLENDPYNSNLLRQRQLLYKANISTIDSFCIDIAREYFYQLNIKQDFRIADSNELAVLADESMENTLDYFYKNGGIAFQSLVKAFSSPRDDKPLVEVISRVYDFLLSHPFPDKWIDEKLLMYDSFTRVTDTPWGQAIISYTESALDYIWGICSAADKIVAEFERLNGYSCQTYFSGLLCYIEKLRRYVNDKDWNGTAGYLKTFKTGNLVFPKFFENDCVKQQLKNCNKNIKDAISRLTELYAWDEEECCEDIHTLSPLVKTLFDCVKYYRGEIERLKAERNIADFSDIEHYMIRLFVKDYKKDGAYELTDTAKEVSRRFDCIMVDECQDINEVQDLIFRSISRNEENLFTVGDVKQSIYGFRQAMPEIFLHRKNSYRLYNREEQNYPSKIILDKNFRSRGEIGSAVNFVFSNLMSEQVGDMDYGSEDYLNCAASFPHSDESAVSLVMIDRSSYSQDTELSVLEARYIAVKIHEAVMKKVQVTEDGKTRDICYGDIAVLLRSTSSSAEIYVKELMNAGIPAYSEKKESFSDAREIKLMLNFLRVIDNPVQDIPLLSLMMSPIFGFTADHMAEIKCCGKFYNLYSSVNAFADAGNNKAKAFLDEISYLRGFAITHSVEELIREIYARTSYPAIVRATEPASNAVKNLELLGEYAARYEKNGYKGLSSFIHYMDKIKACGSDFDAGSLVNGEITNTVKVMSIHASKGLEFPVCFIASASRKFNESDIKKDALIHSSLGIGIKKRQDLCRFTTMPREGVALEISKSNMSEELRVLYVAMTRAKEKLYIISSQKNPEKYLDTLASKISSDGTVSPYAVKNASSISDWIFMCALINPMCGCSNSAGGNSVPYSGESPFAVKWDYELVNKERLDLDEFDIGFPGEIFTDGQMLTCPPEPDFMETLKKRLEFTYPGEPLVNLPTKVSASDLSHREYGGLYSGTLQKPSFLSQKELSSVQKGTAFHKFLQYCDFKNVLADPAGEIKRLKDINCLTAAEADSISVSQAENFINSDLAKRILASKDVMREYRFMSEISAKEYNPDIPAEFAQEKILLQGAVDLAFEDQGQLVIVDYKTDRTKDIMKLKEIYQKQLLLYKNAMELCTDYTVKECVIFSLYLGEYISLNL